MKIEIKRKIVKSEENTEGKKENREEKENY